MGLMPVAERPIVEETPDLSTKASSEGFWTCSELIIVFPLGCAAICAVATAVFWAIERREEISQIFMEMTHK